MGYAKAINKPQIFRRFNSHEDDLSKYVLRDLFFDSVIQEREKETVTQYLFKDSYNIVYYQTPSRPVSFQ